MEITARDLSYKNLINHKELGTVEVVGFNEEIIQYLHLDTIYYDEYSKFEASPLTEEWLLKFGAIACVLDWFVFQDLLSVCLLENNIVRICHNNGAVIDLNIEFVHEFQNAFKVFTKTELTLTK